METRPVPRFLEHHQETLEKRVEAAEKLLSAVNGAAGAAGRRHLTFITLCVYVGLIIASTTDVMLLKISPVKLPLLDVGIPIKGFYAVAPWLMALLHFDLLLQFQVLAWKLQPFNAEVNRLPESHRSQLHKRITSFFYTHLMGGGEHGTVLRWLYEAILWVTLMFLPLGLLLWAQTRFLCYHDTDITLSQKWAVTADILLLWGFWWLLMEDEAKHPAVHPPHRWKPLQTLGAMTLRWRSWIFFACLLFTWQVAKIPGDVRFSEETPWSYLPKVWLESSKKKSSDKVEPEKNHLRRRLEWWFVFRNLDLQEKVLTDNALSPKTINALRTGDAKEREEALKEVVGLDLRGRDLRHANLSGAALPKADMRSLEGQPTQLQGADLQVARLQGALLNKARMIGARLDRAQLQGAELYEAELQGVIMQGVQLQGARLSGAQLQGAFLDYAQLQGAYLGATRLQGAHLDKARMQGADLRGAQLQATDLQMVWMTGADLEGAQLQGANMEMARLQGASLERAQLQGANLEWASIGGADLKNANLDLAALWDLGREPLTNEEFQSLKVALEQINDTEHRDRILSRLKAAIGKKDTLQKVWSAKQCLSDILKLPNCFAAGRLADYRKTLVSYLTQLACSDPYVAKGISWRASTGSYFPPSRSGSSHRVSRESESDLAEALLKADCPAVKGLPEHLKEDLRKVQHAFP
jgi:uncharacterized protein YjbI with pentapeptide repeats